jgi:tRNA pseudouridine55 synthase
VDGILIIDKPAGLTSHDVVARARRILKEKRIGHTGTLDPFATGVLVLLVGRATRLAQFLSGAEKEYEAIIRFGFTTDTGDATGTPKEQVKSHKSKVKSHEFEVKTLKTEAQSPKSEVKSQIVWTSDEIEAALCSLRGEILQVPPMYSAKKVQGRKLYEMARRGIEIEREAVPVTIHQLEALRTGDELLKQNDDGTLEMGVRVVCSAGTYVRVLAEEIGERLGSGAHLSSLRRTRAGQFSLEGATHLDELQERTPAEILLPPDAALSAMPFVHLTETETRRASQGVALRLAATAALNLSDGAMVRLRDESGALIAVGSYEASTQTLRPRVVIAS